MPTKVSVKKIVKKTAKKLTLDDIEAKLERLQKSQDETWVAIKDIQKYIDDNKTILDDAWQSIGDSHKNFNGLNNTFDSLVERIYYSSTLLQKLKQLDFSFNWTVTYRSAEGVYAEIHAMLESQTQAMVVVIEHTLCIADIDDHLVRMKKIRKYANENGDTRQFMGAMAAFITDEPAKNYALKKGLFVIEPSGEDVKVTKPAVEPRVW